MKLKGKLVLVTGASRGIGAAIANELGNAGAIVMGTATTQDGADKITERLNSLNISGAGFAMNVNEQQSIDESLAAMKAAHGMPAILVNNAAINRDNLLLRMKPDEWDSIINTNLSSIFRLSKACLRTMLKARWGRIINISSIVGTTGNPGQSNYAAAKAGLNGFSKSLAAEVASRGITVNVVAPGFIDTDMTRALSDEQREHLLQAIPSKSLGQPEDVAKTVVFLASDDASYITGQTVHVNGGMFMN